ncbi:MAG: ATP-sensitive inward rectifier potassium channel 10 [Sandaracinus sp.]|nr:ATP-sensitive inward rectifier potassium channel 10 [Sandaracinus sp.]MCB9612361.1 ATP-sensitive inward rectifier potassium channel 10 [Sandaracinus sp.]MCB9624229.1 ATP-sensitive inward rectifier potassium channel 10 [Sandaracinus sp.]MCB9633491.1 ATP-sensitive inward rectifier potassium channel 10 [Sandaracinus sp.]
MASKPVDTRPIVVGARPHPLRDAYHALLRASWLVTLSTLSAIYLAIHLLFALAYWRVGGITNATPGSFSDAFFFSVQTLATIGYGGMTPTSDAANTLVTIESIVGLFVTAIFTGLVFTKFATATARIVFSEVVVVGPHEGVPTLMLRIGNDRHDSVLEAHVRIVLTRTVRTKEGRTFYPLVDLKLVRDVAPVLARTFAILHRIDESSPLHGLDAKALAEQEVELMVTVHGIDETTKATVHAVHTYVDTQVLFAHRFVDVLSERPDGRLQLDVRKFHDVERLAS